MKAELRARGIPERCEDKRQGDHRQADVRDEDEEVDRANPAVAGEERVAVEVVIGDVAEQEKRGEDGGADHASHVDEAVATADVDVTRDEAERAQGVEARVGRWKRKHPGGGRDSCFEIDEPNEETGNSNAERDNHRDRLARQLQ